MLTLTDAQRNTLAALADTFVAATPPPSGVDDPHGFYARTGSSVGAPAAFEMALATLDPAVAAGLVQVIDAFTAIDITSIPVSAREGAVAAVAAADPSADLGVRGLRALLLALSYSVVDGTGANPFWRTIGYPAPGTAPALPHALHPQVPPADGLIDADAVVVGSGAGGGVIAAELAAAGWSVVVLEVGDYFDGETAVQHEILAGPMLYYRGGGITTTAEGNVNLWAGATLGGGTTVNWSNCVRPTAARRAEWAGLGLDGLDGPEFDRHLDAVLGRIGANEEVAVLNGPNARLVEGARALGWSHRRAMLNLDPKLVEADRGALLMYGDRTGAKQGTLRTYLVDAAAHGARIFTRTHATRVTVENGRATGVEAVHTVTGAPVTVRARTVVVAGGALETPALLLRSGIGGPAVGRHLRLHPGVLLTGWYAEPQNGWEGPIQSAIVDELTSSNILIETIAAQVGASAATVPWTGAADHKQRMAELGHFATFVAIVGDQGAGTVTIDAAGNAVHAYPIDERERAAFRRGLDALARLHEAAGAGRMIPLTPAVPDAQWDRGADLGAAVRRWQEIPAGFGGHYVGSAHQMGTARMGTDPADSAARPTGELHDVAGVWIGDTSAFPTALGVNPMVTCMALARRTAGRMLG